jgi:hypothetical protein
MEGYAATIMVQLILGNCLGGRFKSGHAHLQKLSGPYCSTQSSRSHQPRNQSSGTNRVPATCEPGDKLGSKRPKMLTIE